MTKVCLAYEKSIWAVPNSSLQGSKFQFGQRKTIIWTKKKSRCNLLSFRHRYRFRTLCCQSQPIYELSPIGIPKNRPFHRLVFRLFHYTNATSRSFLAFFSLKTILFYQTGLKNHFFYVSLHIYQIL